MKESTKKNVTSILEVLRAAEGGIESLSKVVEKTGLTANQVNGSQGIWSHAAPKDGVEPPKALWTVETKEKFTFLRITEEGISWTAPVKKAAPVAKSKVAMTEDEAKKLILAG